MPINPKTFFILFLFFFGLKGFSQNNSFYVSLSYGTANQPKQWIDDIYLGNSDLETVIPDSRYHNSISIGKFFKIKEMNAIQVGLGIRGEYFDTYTRYKNSASISSSRYYSGIIPIIYHHYFKVSPTSNFFIGGGFNMQLYTVFYKNGFNYGESRGASSRTVNGNILEDETTYYYLKQKAPHIVTPQGKILLGFQTKIDEQNSLQTSFSFERDIFKSSVMQYYFEVDDRVNNVQESYSASSRALRRTYFSVTITYNFTLKK